MFGKPTGRLVLRAALVLALAITALPTPASSAPEKLKHLAQVPVNITDEAVADGSDLAFQDDLIVAGSYQGIGFFRRLAKAPYAEQISFFPCPGAQGDVSIWGDLLIVSKESTDEQGLPGTPCNQGSASSKAGLRVIDISKIEQPRQVAFIPLECGSHTNTIVPGKKRLIVYAAALRTSDVTQSNRPGAPCDRDTAAGFAILEVPLSHPEKARQVGVYDSVDGDGCHDVTVVPKRDLAVAACGFTDTQLLDISDPLQPRLISRIVNPAIQFHHQAMVTWDGKYLALSDEALVGGCAGGAQGNIWFYDITDTATPIPVGRYQLPRLNPLGIGNCWAHNFNIVPSRDPARYVLVGGFYTGGLTVVDFSDPAQPVEIAHDVPAGVNMWAAYWYDGLIYTMDWTSGRGLGIYSLSSLGPRHTLSAGPRMNPQVQVLSQK